MQLGTAAMQRSWRGCCSADWAIHRNCLSEPSGWQVAADLPPAPPTAALLTAKARQHKKGMERQMAECMLRCGLTTRAAAPRWRFASTSRSRSRNHHRRQGSSSRKAHRMAPLQ